jgi:hypothetical protein
MEDNERYARYTRPDGDGPELGLLLEALVEDAKGYFEAQRDLIGFNSAEKGGRIVAILLLVLVVAVLLGGVLVMLSIAMALWLSEVIGSLPLGFLATGGVHLLLAGLFYLLWRAVLRERIILAIINAVHGEH